MKDAFEKLFRAVHQFKKLKRIRPDTGTQQFRIFRYGCDFANGRKRKNYKLRAGGEDQNTSAGCVAHTARTGGKRICRAER